MSRRSRLSQKTEKKSTQTLILSVLGIAVVLFLLFRYGIPLLSDASFLFGTITGGHKNDQAKNQKNDNYVASPGLDQLPQATKEKNIKVTGTSLSGSKVQLYLNGNKDDEIDVDNDGSFEFDVQLSEGENIIKTKAIKGKNESEFSDSIAIVYKKEGANLNIDSPSDGAELSGVNPIEVRGKTDVDSTVLVNDFQAIIDEKGNWSYFLTLKNGDNEIKVVTIDLAGNKTEKTIKVKYSQ